MLVSVYSVADIGAINIISLEGTDYYFDCVLYLVCLWLQLRERALSLGVVGSLILLGSVSPVLVQ